MVARSGSSSSAEEEQVTATHEMPIFPLGVVAMPTVDTILQIFEARYRVLFHTLLDGEHECAPSASAFLLPLCSVLQGIACASIE